MSDYCHRKAVRFKIDEKSVCRLLKVEDRWDINDLLKAPFEISPTKEFFIDYNLPCSNDAEGDWGRIRRLYPKEYDKYERLFNELFGELFGYQLRCHPDDFRLVEYCWYDCSEAPDYFDESTYHDDFYDEV